MSERIKATIRAAELLRSMAGTTGSPLQALMAFFEPILLDLKDRRYDPAEFATKIRQAYGWNFNEEVAEGFRDWFVRNRWLTPKRNSYGSVTFDEKGPFHVITPVQTKSVEQVASSTLDDRLDKIIREFRQFLPAIGVNQKQFNKSDEQILEIVLAFLLDLGESGDVNTPAAERVSRGEGPLSDQDRYLVARFVQNAYNKNVGLAEDLQWIGSVGLLAELAEDFRKPRSHVKRSKVTIFLDSPLALDLLGTSGKNAAALTRTLVEKLQKIGATVTMFDDSVREMQATVSAVLRAEPFERFGPMQEAIFAGETDEGFLNAVANDPASVLRPYQIIPRTKGDDRRLTDDSYFTDKHLTKLYNEFLAVYGNDAGYERRCGHDADAAAKVMRLRKGHVSSDMFDSSFVFLTRNRSITGIARQFAVKNDLIDSTCVGPFINLHDMASSLWLRTGLATEDEIPRRQILAGCERVLTRNQTVVAEARRAILSLRKQHGLDEDRLLRVEAILNQDRSMLLLSDKVRGSGVRVTSEDVSRIVEDFAQHQRSAGIAIGEAKARSQVSEETHVLKTQADEAAAESERLRQENQAAADRISKTLSDVEALQDRVRQLEEQDERRLGRLFIDANAALAQRRWNMRYALLIVAILILIVAVWREIANDIHAPAGGLLRVFFERHFLFICGVLPVVAIFADNLLRILGLDQPVERYLFEEWSKKKLLRMAEERGLVDHRLLMNPVLLYSEGRVVLAGTTLGMPTKGASSANDS